MKQATKTLYRSFDESSRKAFICRTVDNYLAFLFWDAGIDSRRSAC